MNFEKEKNPYIHTVYYTGFFFKVHACSLMQLEYPTCLTFFCPRARSQTTLPTYLPLVYIYEEICLLLYDISITTSQPTYLVLT